MAHLNKGHEEKRIQFAPKWKRTLVLKDASKKLEAIESYEKQKTLPYDRCSKCSLMSTQKLCKCHFQCRTCPNGHTWYKDRYGVRREGHP